MPYLTPDNAPSTLRGIVVYIPDDDEFVSHLLGALAELAAPENWELSGAVTEQQTAELWRDANDYTVTTSIYPG